MRERLRQALALCSRWLWRREGGGASKGDPDAEDGRRPEARARFWRELREGQREAEAMIRVKLPRELRTEHGS